ncbi:hypothetical protein QR66_19165, partial [Chromobacterium piscinae]
CRAAPQGCRLLVRDASGYCEAHRKETRREVDQRRGSAASRGYDSRWAKARATFLRRRPLCECEACKRLGLLTPATVVDHIRPHKLKVALESGDPNRIAQAQALFWDSRNWMPMAKRCHDRKTAREDGGFGNVKKGRANESEDL